MPEINQQELKRQIKENALSAVYFLYGDDVYLKQNFADQIAKKVVGTGQEHAISRYSGKDFSLDDFAGAVLTPTFFGGRKCVLISDYNANSASKSEAAQLLEILGEIEEDCIVIFSYNSLEIGTKITAKFRNFMAEIAKIGSVIQLNHPDSAALIKILTSAAVKRGGTLGTGAARHLITVCGNDLQTLISEVDKLTALAGEEEISIEMIDAICIKSVETSIYMLSKSLQSGNIEGAISVLDQLYEQRIEPVVILSTLSGAYVDMYRAKIAAAAGKRATDVAKDFGYYGTEFRLRNAATLASRMSTAALRRSLMELAKADGRLKSSRVDSRVIIEETMVKLLILAKQS